MIVAGHNVYPTEIETVLLEDPMISDAAVASLQDEVRGEEVIAFVVRRDGADLAAPALDQLCLDNIARFKRPRSYRFVDTLPKNNYGKILKTELRHLLEREGMTSE